MVMVTKGIAKVFSQVNFVTVHQTFSLASNAQVFCFLEPPPPPSHFFEIREEGRVYARIFNTQRRRYVVNFRNTEDLLNATTQLVTIFDAILTEITNGLAPTDRVGIQIDHDALNTPILIPLMPLDRLTGLKILNAIERVLQSKTDLKIDENLCFTIVTVRSPAGGRPPESRLNFACNIERWIEKHSGHGGCFINIKNKDELCLARALVVAMAKLHEKNPIFQYSSVKNGDQGRGTSIQKRLAIQLMHQAGLANHRGPCGIPELQKFADLLEPMYQIKVFSFESRGMIFIGKPSRYTIYLFLHRQHYRVVTSMPAFFSRSYFCHHCNKAYSNREEHRCAHTCPCCYSQDACPNVKLITCDDCKRFFRGQICYNNHKIRYKQKGNNNKRQKVESSICDRVKRCAECNEHIHRANLKQPHQCGFFECRTCKKIVEKENHLCYMQKIGDDDDDDEIRVNDNNVKADKIEQIPIFVFYDFECTQEKKISESIFEHEPNLVIAHVTCDECRKWVGDFVCKRCGEKRKIFWGKECLNNFAKWLFADTRKCITAMAHNSKGYDGQLIMRYLVNNGVIPLIVNKGLELMLIKVGNVRLIDSLCFLPMPLSALPRAFGVEELAKGYFPHLFNREENWKYKGPFPKIEYYSPETMKTEAKEKFLKWYEGQKDKVFDFEKEIEKYCESDVDILKRCCLEFRDIFMKKTGVDPFANSLTIASACNKVFRTNFLEPDAIGLIPAAGYRRNDKQSKIGYKWLKWMAHSKHLDIQHAYNRLGQIIGEKRIGKYRVDGVCGRNVYEYNGCYFHGCPNCMGNREQMIPNEVLTAQAAYERTIARRTFIEQQKVNGQNYRVIEMWDCQLRNELKRNPVMKQFFDSIEILDPMDPREAFYGGRTNAIKLYDKIRFDKNGNPLDRIDYIDVCSLYPYICKYGTFPRGHPTILTENFQPLETRPYNGLIKCKILPPRKLYHPLLPYRSNKKLTFPLCRTCADDRLKETCRHSDEERAITSAWCSLEVYKAMELGYKVLRIYEVYHYDNMETYHPITNPSGGMFTGYINQFIQMKQQADGWPSWAKTERDKEKYIADYEKNEGVALECDKIEKNPGLRALAKLMLNSFWGKFGQRNNMSKLVYFTDAQKYFEHIYEVGRVVHSIIIVSDNMVAVTSTMEEDFVDILPNTNPVIAAFTTAQARLHLYKYIEMLGERVLYFDTDSIVYKSTLNTNDGMVPTNSYLGCMTDELEKDYGIGSYIVEFVAGGPKNYAYAVYSTKDKSIHYSIKVRGFSLTSSISKKINFDSLKRLVHKFVENNNIENVPVEYMRIERTKERNLITRHCTKNYRIVYDKRVVKNDFTTLPYGY